MVFYKIAVVLFAVNEDFWAILISDYFQNNTLNFIRKFFKLNLRTCIAKFNLEQLRFWRSNKVVIVYEADIATGDIEIIILLHFIWLKIGAVGTINHIQSWIRQRYQLIVGIDEYVSDLMRTAFLWFFTERIMIIGTVNLAHLLSLFMVPNSNVVGLLITTVDEIVVLVNAWYFYLWTYNLI